MEKDIQQILTAIKELIYVLPEEYYQKKNEYQFASILREYFFSIDDVAEIKETDISEKEQFLKYLSACIRNNKTRKRENKKNSALREKEKMY